MPSSPLPSACQAMLHMLRQRHGIDFTHYQPGSLLRRINLRMQQLGIADYAAYADYLASQADETHQLVNTLLINHSSFFRDLDVWTAIAAEIIPRMVANRSAAAPLRIWSAGCAAGQEPYSLAILLAEYFGPEHLAANATIYATDVDLDALEQVRQARYLPWSVRTVPPALLERYFTFDGMRYVVREELRRAVVVERHNLLADAPFPQIDLLLCRNVLIYLNAAAQQQVARQLRAALADDGALVLGKGELALPGQQGLRWLDRRHRIAAKALGVAGALARDWQADSWYV